MPQLSIHPLCALFPRMSDEEYKALCEDIRRNGLRQPIIIFEGKILDGVNRNNACLELGIEPEIVQFEGNDPLAFVLSLNLRRRHLTAGQQAAIVAAATDWQKAQPKGKPKMANVGHLATVEQRAARSGASRNTQKMADKVAKADPELAKKVAHGEVTLPQAAATVARMTSANRSHTEPSITPEVAREMLMARASKVHSAGKPRTGPKAEALRAGLTEASLHAGSLLCTYARLTLGSVRAQETFVEEERGLIQELDSAIHQRGLGASQS